MSEESFFETRTPPAAVKTTLSNPRDRRPLFLAARVLFRRNPGSDSIAFATFLLTILKLRA
jgi:hypothetical protein